MGGRGGDGANIVRPNSRAGMNGQKAGSRSGSRAGGQRG